jgi:hypothetical protein
MFGQNLETADGFCHVVCTISDRLWHRLLPLSVHLYLGRTLMLGFSMFYGALLNGHFRSCDHVHLLRSATATPEILKRCDTKLNCDNFVGTMVTLASTRCSFIVAPALFEFDGLGCSSARETIPDFLVIAAGVLFFSAICKGSVLLCHWASH